MKNSVTSNRQLDNMTSIKLQNWDRNMRSLTCSTLPAPIRKNRLLTMLAQSTTYHRSSRKPAEINEWRERIMRIWHELEMCGMPMKEIKMRSHKLS